MAKTADANNAPSKTKALLAALHRPCNEECLKDLYDHLDTLPVLMPPRLAEHPKNLVARKDAIIALAVNVLEEQKRIETPGNSLAQQRQAITQQLTKMNKDSQAVRWSNLATEAAKNCINKNSIIPLTVANEKIWEVLKDSSSKPKPLIEQLYEQLDKLDAMFPATEESLQSRHARQDHVINLAINYIHEGNGTNYLLSPGDKRTIIPLIQQNMTVIYESTTEAQWEKITNPSLADRQPSPIR